MTGRRLTIALLLATLAILTACSGFRGPAPDSWAGMRQADGSVTWMDEYNFVPPPAPWRLLDLSEDDYSVAFFRACTGDMPGEFPCESSMAYAGEPFGYSRDFDQRQKEFFKRYLWASRVIFEDPVLKRTTINGREALVATTMGVEPDSGHRVKSKVVFLKRGERIEALFMNQWRSRTNGFDMAEFEVFDRFVASFRYVKPSFYEQL